MEKEIKAQKELAQTAVFHICFMQCKNMMASTSGLVFRHNVAINKIAIFVILFLYLRYFFKYRMSGGVNLTFVKVLTVIVAWWTFSKIKDSRLFSDTQFPYNYVINQRNLFVAYGLPLFYAMLLTKKADYMLTCFFKAARITFVFAAISTCLYVFSPDSAVQRGYSMSLGNQMLLTCVLLMFKYIDERKITDLFLFGLTVIFIIIGGSRGPLVSILVLMVYFQSANKKTKSGAVLFIAEILAIIVLVVFSKEIIEIISNVFERWNISSRTLSMLMSENISSNSGRSLYHEALLEAINNSPILGLGAFGGEKTVGLAHSLYIDIWANMGYIIGTVFIIVLTCNILMIIKNHHDSPRVKIILMMSIILFPRGFFDETFWGAWQLWVIMGLLSSRENDDYTVVEMIHHEDIAN